MLRFSVHNCSKYVIFRQSLRFKNILRTSNEEFFGWIESKCDMSRIRNTLDSYPDLVKIKDNFRCNNLHIVVFVGSSINFQCNTNCSNSV